MRKTLMGGLAVAALTLSFTACSSDNAGGAQAEVADMMIEAFESEDLEGIELDEDCVREVADELSDDDAQKIVDAGIDGDPDVSDEADEIGDKLADCVSF